jgi:hypothetical protein
MAQRFGPPAVLSAAANTGRIGKGRNSDGGPKIKPGRVEPVRNPGSLAPSGQASRWRGSPYPPAVGVWMMIASSASMTVASQPSSRSIDPSLRRTQFSPT